MRRYLLFPLAFLLTASSLPVLDQQARSTTALTRSPTDAKSLEKLEATSFILDKRVDVVLTGRTAGEPAFDPVAFDDLKHALARKATEFTLDSRPITPKPAVVMVACSVDRIPIPGATVTAKTGRFIASVEAQINDSSKTVKLGVKAVQDDGTPPDITYP
jgi:hypothetical protein